MPFNSAGHFIRIHEQAQKDGVMDMKAKQSKEWYRNKASNMLKMNVSRMFQREDLQKEFPSIGRVCSFVYDAKHKDDPAKLPYWDRFPMIVPIEFNEGGFLGLNFHYLSHYYRAQFLDALYKIISDKKMDENTRFRVTYEVLKGAKRFRAYKGCIKQYLWTQVRSPFVDIPPPEWDYALFLPLERFTGKGRSEVWFLTGKIIRGEK